MRQCELGEREIEIELGEREIEKLKMLKTACCMSWNAIKDYELKHYICTYVSVVGIFGSSYRCGLTN